MKKLIIFTLCLTTFCYAKALVIPHLTGSIPLEQKIALVQDDFISPFNEENHSQNIGNLMVQTDKPQTGAFEIPPELVAILPPGQKMLANNNCFLTPAYVVLGFDASVGANDGKGFSFTFSINMLNPDIQNDETAALKELMTMSLNNDMTAIRQKIHPTTNDEFTDVVIKPWGGGGSYKWIMEWDGNEIPVYSSYYAGKINDVYFTLRVDGPNTSIPEQIADKLAQMAQNSLTYKSIKTKIQN